MGPGLYCGYPYMPVPSKLCTPLWKFSESFQSKLTWSSSNSGVSSGTLPKHWVLSQALNAENKGISHGKWIFTYFGYFLRLQKYAEYRFITLLRKNDIFWSYQPTLFNEPWNYLKSTCVCMHACIYVCTRGQGGRGNQRHLISKHDLFFTEFDTHNLI